jgi:putative tryptophan/tyrosine transport system substrate-binding protein
MRRREFMGLLASAPLAWPFAALAQSSAKVHRVALVLTTSTLAEMAGPDPAQPVTRALLHGLRKLGYVEGQNLIFERRSAEGRFERFGEIVAELAAGKVDVIVTGGGNESAQVAKRVTSTVPIVMGNSQDPVAAGIVDSLARPGGNVTGFTGDTGAAFEVKRLQMLKQAVPDATRIGFLGVQSEWDGLAGDAARSGARAMGLTLVHATHTPTDFSDAFALIRRERLHALFVVRHGAIFGNRQRIAEFAVEYGIPGMFTYREIVVAGGLMSYGVNLTDQFRRAAATVDKILKGTKPADIPVEQPTKFEFVVNLKTAGKLGLDLPATLLGFADEVID